MTATETEPRPAVETKRRRLAPLTYALITAALALASSLAALVFTLWPGLKPDPRDRLGADVSVFAVEPGVGIGEWIRRTSTDRDDRRGRTERYLRTVIGPGPPPEACERAEYLAAPGHAIYVRVAIEGFKRREVQMRWSMYDQRSRQRVPELSDRTIGAIALDSPAARSVVQIWVPPAPGHALVFARIELIDPAHTTLAVADSPRFSGRVPDEPPSTCG